MTRAQAKRVCDRFSQANLWWLSPAEVARYVEALRTLATPRPVSETKTQRRARQQAAAWGFGN